MARRICASEAGQRVCQVYEYVEENERRMNGIEKGGGSKLKPTQIEKKVYSSTAHGRA